MPIYANGADGGSDGNATDPSQKVFVDLPHDTIFQWLWARNLSWWDDLKAVMESHAAMISTLRETTDKHRATLSALTTPAAGMATLAGSMPTTLAETDTELNADAAIAEAQSIVTQSAATGLEADAVAATGEAAATAGPALATEGATAAVTTVAAPETAGTSWLVLGIVTLVVAGVVATALYELDQQIHDAVNAFIGKVWHGLMPGASTSTTHTPTQTTPVANTGAAPRRLTLIDPAEPVTETERARLRGLRHEFPGMDLEILALIRAGYSDSDIRRILRNIFGTMQRNGVNYTSGSVLFAVPMPPNPWNPGQIVFLEQGSATSGWYHILNGTDPVTDPGHRADFIRCFGPVSDDEIQWMLMDALATEQPISFVPDMKRGGGAYTYLISVNGEQCPVTIVVGSNGYVVSAYPSDTP